MGLPLATRSKILNGERLPSKIFIKDLRRAFHELVALAGVTARIEEGELVCILGPSGCGKTTLLNILAGLDNEYGGDILIQGRPLQRGGNWGLRVGYVFQEPRLLPWLNVEENIRFALYCEGFPREVWDEIVERYVALVGLKGFEHSYPHQLSGGMQQRTSIARSLAIDPEILLMDEPFSGLDEITARRLRKELLEIWQETQKTILFVTHNSFEATFLGDRILLITRRPARIYREVVVDLPRPRDYDDPQLSNSIAK